MPLPVPDISRNLFDLSGYCTIVTGAGQDRPRSGRGARLCWERLGLTERNAEHFEVGARKIEANGRKVTTIGCDVAADGN
jgi:hypothetical protein